MAQKNSAQTNKQTNRQTDRQTNRHYENNGHLAMNQLFININIKKAGVKRDLLDTVKARKRAYCGHTMRKQGN